MTTNPHQIRLKYSTSTPEKLASDATDGSVAAALQDAKLRAAIVGLKHAEGFESCLGIIESIDPSSLREEQRIMLATLSLQRTRLAAADSPAPTSDIEAVVQAYSTAPRFVATPDDPGIIEFGFANGQVSLR